MNMQLYKLRHLGIALVEACGLSAIAAASASTTRSLALFVLLQSIIPPTAEGARLQNVYYSCSFINDCKGMASGYYKIAHQSPSQCWTRRLCLSSHILYGNTENLRSNSPGQYSALYECSRHRASTIDLQNGQPDGGRKKSIPTIGLAKACRVTRAFADMQGTRASTPSVISSERSFSSDTTDRAVPFRNRIGHREDAVAFSPRET